MKNLPDSLTPMETAGIAGKGDSVGQSQNAVYNFCEAFQSKVDVDESYYSHRGLVFIVGMVGT
jgi:hypothetical protein